MNKENYSEKEIKEALNDQRRYSLNQRLKILNDKRFEKSLKNIIKWTFVYIISIFFEGFFSVIRFENRFDKKLDSITKIFVIKLEHIGDVILSTPVYREIKKAYPNAKLYLLTTSKIEDTIKNNPYIHKVINIDPKFTNRSWDNLNRLNKSKVNTTNFLNILKIMLLIKPEIAISLRNDYNNIFINYFSGARIRIGHNITPYGFLLTNKINYDAEKHEIERNLELINVLRIYSEDFKLEIFPGNEEFEYANKFFKDNSIKKNDFVVCMHIGGSGNIKWWPIERFIKVADYLIKKYKAKIIILGKGKDEEEQGDLLKNRFKDNIIKSFNSSVLQKAAIIKKSKLFICNDSGPMHIGAAVKTPMIALFGPGAYKYYKPLDKIHTVIYKNLPCSPCAPFVQNEKNDCPDNICMKLINTDEVIKDIDEKIRKHVDFIKTVI